MERHAVKDSPETTSGSHNQRWLGVTSAAIASLLLLLLLAPSASAKEAIAYFGTDSASGTLGGQFKLPGDIAVNSTGAGPADRGDIYVVDGGNGRIQRFGQDDNGTPANPYDDSYPFISAWGADVDGATSGGSNYEICTVAASCKAAVAVGGANGTLGLNGIGFTSASIAVDQDSGDVYVADANNNRVNVYSGEGPFLRSFGFDVVASGPGDTDTGFEICVAANGDVCKTGVSGSGIGQLKSAQDIAVSQPDGNPANGTAFVSDGGNFRVNTYNLDGTSPSSFGSEAEFDTEGPFNIAVDSRGIVYVESGHQPDAWVIARYDSQNANGGGVGFLAPIGIPPLLTAGGGQVNGGLEVDPDSDGPGPDSDVLYALRSYIGGVVQQFGPINPPGETAPPTDSDATHGVVADLYYPDGLGADYGNGRLFLSTLHKVGSKGFGSKEESHGVFVLDEAGGAPSGTLDSVSDVTATSAELHATVNPNGPPDVTYQVEFSADGTTWQQLPQVVVGSQETSQALNIPLNPPPGGLEPSTFYHVRLSVTKAFMPPVITAEKTFTTLAAGPLAETTGTPLRTVTTARFEGRVNPRKAVTSYHFEYGDAGPCSVNVCTATPSRAAGSGSITQLVSERIGGLQPNTIYHYRLVAENGVGSPAFGEDMTVTTRADEDPLSHGRFPGPPGSDRAYEQVSMPDTGGNPVGIFNLRLADTGNRALYSVQGGTPISDTGNIFGFYFSERTSSGWETKSSSPPRSELVGSFWNYPSGPPDLSSIVIWNRNPGARLETGWRLSPSEAPSRIFDIFPPRVGNGYHFSAAGSPRVVIGLMGSELDPTHPVDPGRENLYDVTSGSPELVSLMPDGGVPKCGVLSQTTMGLSDDGSKLFFFSKEDGCSSASQFYMRDLENGETKAISGTPISGSNCGTEDLLRVTSEGVYFWTQNRLDPADINPAGCFSVGSGAVRGGDIYRYAINNGSLKCLTCVIPGLDADVAWESSLPPAAVAPDGSRIYFRSASPTPLVAGAVTGNHSEIGSTYLLDVGSGELRWLGSGINIDNNFQLASPDGAVAFFSSESPNLNPTGGLDNGGKSQLYRYDDRDRSLVCVSCPQDGSPAASGLTSDAAASDTPASADGKVAAFATALPLVAKDQNTAGPAEDPSVGTDVYEWRDGRLFLISDGLTSWPRFAEPRVADVSRSGRDLFFLAATQYTPDALDGYTRLYDARIGGGFEYPKPPKPCPLEVCQGTPKGAPEEQAPGTGSFAGLGNAAKPRQGKARCAPGKRKVRRDGRPRCFKPKSKKHAKARANHHRRTGR